jgi:kynurenine formamidase
MWIDLTMPIRPDMPTNPAHILPEFDQYDFLSGSGWDATRIQLSTHTGTHMDAPSHFIAGARTIEQTPLDVFTGAAQVISLSGLEERQAIEPEDLGVITCRRVLVNTGWSDRVDDHDRYFNRYPYLSDDAARYLVEHGVQLVGVDTPSVDYHPPSAVHLAVLGSGGVIVENLSNLGQLGTECEFIVLPLPLAGLDGSPVRAMATAAGSDA